MSPLVVAGLLGADSDSIEEPVTNNLLTLWLSIYAAISRGGTIPVDAPYGHQVSRRRGPGVP
jgi:hypothetical protein